MEKFGLVAIFIAMSVISASTQDRRATGDEGPGVTVEQALQSHHIQLTRPALIEALRNGDWQVRSLAAYKLATEGAKESIPALEAALAIETVPQARPNLAYALAKLGQGQGTETLNGICKDSSEKSFVRAEAARLILRVSSESPACLDAMIELLGRADITTKMSAAGLLPEFHDLSAADAERVLGALLKTLEASDAALRHAASRALGRIGNPSAIPYLQNAINNERDQNVRSEMESDLKKLQQNAER